MYDILQLNDMILPELKEIADKLKIRGADKLEKQELILKVLDAQALNPVVQEESERSKDRMKKPRLRKPIDPDLKAKTEKGDSDMLNSSEEEEGAVSRNVSEESELNKESSNGESANTYETTSNYERTTDE